MGVDEEHREQIIRLLLNNRNATVVVVATTRVLPGCAGRSSASKMAARPDCQRFKNNNNETV